MVQRFLAVLMASGVAALTLAACSQSSNSSTSVETSSATSEAAEASAAPSTAASAMAAAGGGGSATYNTNCASCHQSSGAGVPGAFPPLAGNPLVTGNPTAVVAIVKNGLDGRVVVNGVAYSGIMPHWSGVLSDDQIASVITYIRSAWHNSAPGVSAAQVRGVK